MRLPCIWHNEHDTKELCRMPSTDSVFGVRSPPAPPPACTSEIKTRSGFYDTCPDDLEAAPPPPLACTSQDAGDVDDDGFCDSSDVDALLLQGVYDTCPDHLMPWHYDDCHGV